MSLVGSQSVVVITCVSYLCTVCCFCLVLFFFFFKPKTAFDVLISDWSSDVCSSDLAGAETPTPPMSPAFSPGAAPRSRRSWARKRSRPSSPRLATIHRRSCPRPPISFSTCSSCSPTPGCRSLMFGPHWRGARGCWGQRKRRCKRRDHDQHRDG